MKNTFLVLQIVLQQQLKNLMLRLVVQMAMVRMLKQVQNLKQLLFMGNMLIYF